MKVSLNLNNLIIDHNYYGGNQDIYVNVCDEGLLKKVNLSNWIKTSNNGSFIYYY